MERAYGSEDVEIVALSMEGSTGLMEHGAQRQARRHGARQVAALYYVQQKHEYGDLRWWDRRSSRAISCCTFGPTTASCASVSIEAIRDALERRHAERIYDKYGLWNEDQEELARSADHWPP